MYKHIGVPVDLAHREQLDKALDTACTLASTFGARMTLLAVAGPAPGGAAHSPRELAGKLDALAATLADRSGQAVATRVEVVGDPVADLDRTLNRQFHELEVDLVVMASHMPGIRDYVFHSNAGFLASHTDLSVFVVRD
jgi:nucleotide-binding universal stress UspA family protein